MAPNNVPFLYTEARVNIEPTFPASVCVIATGGASSAAVSRRAAKADAETCLDEDDLAQQCLATNSSIFFRKTTRSPRNILWRVLNEQRLLTLQAIDLLTGRKSTQESVLTFAISFNHPIRPFGVAFADSQDTDAFHVFVLTVSNELVTITLRRDLLLRSNTPSVAEFDPGTCFKTYRPSSFSFRHPYKLVAITPHDLLVTLHDGGLLRLERKTGDHGVVWRETFFSEGGWGSSLRSLIPWKSHSTLRFNDIDLQPTTITAAESSPDANHIFTVSLDHTVKAWNAQTGKVGLQFDLLGEPRIEGQVPVQTLIDPHHGSLIRICLVSDQPAGDLYYVVTHSPKDRQFKFWGVRDADSEEYGIRDLHPDIKLIPPVETLMETTAWQIADFDLRPGPGWRDTQLWVRARSGSVCNIFTLTFDLLSSRDDMEDAWSTRWVAVEEGASSIERIMADSVSRSGQDSTTTDAWLGFFFLPGRFDPTLLETALVVYVRGAGKASSLTSRRPKPVMERLCAAIAFKAAEIMPNRAASQTLDERIAAQWAIFFGLVRHLHQRGSELLSLALDIETGLAWSVRAGQVAPIRVCSDVEISRLNETLLTSHDDGWIMNSLPLADHLTHDSAVGVARLLAAARGFRGCLSPTTGQMLVELSSNLALVHVGKSAQKAGNSDRSNAMIEIYEQCQFGVEINDEDYGRLMDDTQDLGGLGGLENDLFEAAMQTLSETARGQRHDNILTRFGDRVTVSASQDALLAGRDILLDLLALVIFVSQDLEPDELARGFDALTLFDDLMVRLKEYNVLIWLAVNVRQEPARKRKAAQTHDNEAASTEEAKLTLTLYESIFIGDWQGLPLPNDSWPSVITYWSRAWTFGANLTTAYDGVTAYIMGNLLRNENFVLAADFSKHLSHSSWTNYLVARLYLAQGENAMAGELFKRCSQELSNVGNKKIDTLDAAGLLSPVERRSFGDGIPRFFLHVHSLFEAAALPSFAADFAQLALDELEADDRDYDDSMADVDRRKRGSQDSPAAARVDLAMEEINLLRLSDLREDITGRLFSAALQTFRFDLAFSALVKLRNPALRRSCLQHLIQSLLQTHSVSVLLALDWPRDLVGDVDSILIGLARKSLNASTTVSHGLPPYHAVLYSWRIHGDDYRGAAEIVFEFLQHLKAEQARDGYYSFEDERLLEAYLVLINTLATCGPDEAWILAEHDSAGQAHIRSSSFTKKLTMGLGAGKSQGHGAGDLLVKEKRSIVTLDDVRREYTMELDRRSEMAQGRFGIIGNEMDLF